MSRGYKFLIMQSNDNNNVGFLSGFMGGSVSASPYTKVTNFKPHDFGGGHENDEYWNSAEDLLVGFARWYLRIDEKESYSMGNRIYAATDTFRFFRIDEDLDDYKSELDQVDIANNDIVSFEITEAEFISNMLTSWAFEQVSSLFPDTQYDMQNRMKPRPVVVGVVYNKEHNTWSWSSDYRHGDYKGLELKSMEVMVGLHYDEAIGYISARANCPYRFGGNDYYNKRKQLEREALEEENK
tara:strand:+ start:940 stop:1659 length:720 start_codon:yes stop_codon:yes gene_type:complete